MIIDGKKIAGIILAGLKKSPAPAKELAAVYVGDDPASASFLRQKAKAAGQLGAAFRVHKFESTIKEPELIEEIKKLGRDASVGGIIVQLPLPEKFNRDKVIAAIDPDKDIDALTPGAKVSSLAVEVVKDILNEAGWPVEEKRVGIVGRGILVGEPVARWLSGKCKDLIIFHTKTDLDRIKECDLVILGAGKAGLIKPEMLKPGVGVIDFGFPGDLDASSPAVNGLGFYTPTPGGTGPILVAEIFKNFYALNK